MESPGAHTRSSLLATAAAVALLSLLALALLLTRAGSARASSTAAAGGTAPPASTPSTAGGAAVKSGTGPSAGRGPAGGTATGRSKSSGTSTKAPAAKTGAATAVKIAGARCVPVTSCSTKQHEVSTHGNLLMQGSGLRGGEAVAFPRSWHAHIASNSPSAHLHMSKLGLVVTVPASAHSGSIEVRLPGGRHSNAYGPISVVTYKLHPPAPPAPAVPPASTATTASGTAFAGQGMWIWYMSASDGGNVASIVEQAHAAGVSTLYIKSSDGSSNYWSQFSPQLVAELHANGLKACAWQYVYGTNPTGEADLGAQAVANGADCLVIDAESQYEGHYA